MVDVDTTFDEALRRVGRRIIATFKNGYYDPTQMAALVEHIGRERGDDLDIHCYYNDRRLTAEDKPVDTPPTPDDVRAALPATTIDHEPLARRIGERLFAAVEEKPGSFHLTLEADTWHLSRDAMTALARTIEETAVQSSR
jgi:hypothetical protein